jgi:hypothetical protein
MTSGRFYHVTYEGRLSRIAVEGLLPGQGRVMGSAAYAPHVAGGFFVTAPEGLPYWYERAEEWAHHSADDLLAEGWIPVVLRVRVRRCVGDQLGTADAGHPAFKCKEGVPPDQIELWEGTKWIPIEDYETLDPTIAVDEDGYMLSQECNGLVPRPHELNPGVAAAKSRLLAY